MHADIGTHGGTPAVTVRLARQFQALDTEGRVRRRLTDTTQQRVAGGYGGGHRIQLGPVERFALNGAVQGMQPAPAFTNQDRGVVVAWFENLEEALSATFEADQSAIAFGEAGYRQLQVGF